MYTLTVKDHFDAAHNLYGYPGECRNLHGHTWDVEVSVASPHLDGIGIVYDFKNLKDDLKSILSTYDHTYINENEPFDTMSPTAENLARVICLRLQEMITADVVVKEVAVWESPIARVGYSPTD
ncbi:MAG: 6-carboxytetrahydropterin synthase QueD [Coriobacteriia bacterium]|nr:6-carboxytetrahydropterin synthase QueD [Coriobacteriia bacterium]